MQQANGTDKWLRSPNVVLRPAVQTFCRIVALFFLLIAGVQDSFSQIKYSTNIVGYLNCSFMTGSNLFNDPFQIGVSNGLNEIFAPYPLTQPEGTTVSLWNPVTSSFDITSTFTNGSWTTNLTLPPGTGVLLVTPASFTNTFAGIVLGHNGDSYAFTLLNPPPLFTGPNGVYLLGDKCGPFLDNIGTNIFISILGRFPYVGEQVITLTNTSTYLGNGQWDSVPTLAPGEAAFLNIKSEPPPLLTIQYNANQAVISWPFSSNSWTLQTNNSLAAGGWGIYTGSVINNTVTNSPLTGNLFFRLSYP